MKIHTAAFWRTTGAAGMACVVVFVAGCGSPDPTSKEAAPQAVTPPQLSLTADATSGEAPLAVLLQWAGTGVTGCLAASDWSGPRATTGSEHLSLTRIGAHVFSLTCTGPGGSVTRQVQVTTSDSNAAAAVEFQRLRALENNAANP